MAATVKNAGKPWTDDDVKMLRKLVDENTPTRVIALKMGRSESAIYSAASRYEISLMPMNQSPYG